MLLCNPGNDVIRGGRHVSCNPCQKTEGVNDVIRSGRRYNPYIIRGQRITCVFQVQMSRQMATVKCVVQHGFYNIKDGSRCVFVKPRDDTGWQHRTVDHCMERKK